MLKWYGTTSALILFGSFITNAYVISFISVIHVNLDCYLYENFISVQDGMSYQFVYYFCYIPTFTSPVIWFSRHHKKSVTCLMRIIFGLRYKLYLSYLDMSILHLWMIWLLCSLLAAYLLEILNILIKSWVRYYMFI